MQAILKNKRLLYLPVFFIILFYGYFMILAGSLYNWFDINALRTVLMIPGIYSNTLFTFFLYCVFFGVLLYISKLLFRIVFSMFLFLLVIILGIQYFSIAFSGTWLISEAFYQVEAYRLYLTTGRILMVIGLILACVAVIFLFFRLEKERFSLKELLTHILITTLIFGVSYLSYFGYHTVSKNNPHMYGTPKQAPEIAFINTLRFAFFEKDDYLKYSLPDSTIEKMNRIFGFSIKIANNKLVSKEWIYKKAIPVQFDSLQRKPNIIVFFCESLSACMLNCYSQKYPGLTPNIDSFAAGGCMVKQYYNHTSPTVNGLIGQLCSFYPSLTMQEIDSNNWFSYYNPISMPDILAHYGYKNYYLTHEDKGYYISLRNLMTTIGFDTSYMKQDLVRMFKLKDSYYLKDGDMFNSVVGFLKKKELTPEPFFLAVSTIGTHVGTEKIGETQYKYGDGKQSLLNKVKTLDNAFGVFLEYFKKSPLSENTIVVLTGDHVFPPVQEIQDITDSKNYSTYFQELALIIHSPGHRLPRNIDMISSSIDLAPTMLQLVGIREAKNCFMGLSLLGDRSDFPSVLSFTNEASRVINNSSKTLTPQEIEDFILFNRKMNHMY